MNAPAALAKCLAALTPEVKKATVYLSDREVVSICRRHKYRKRSRYEVLVTKIGQPNYLERAFIRACKKAGETFPLKRVQLKPWPAKRKPKRCKGRAR